MPPRKQVTYSQRPNHAARSAHARGEREFRTYDTSYIRPKQSKGPKIFAAVLAVVVIGGLAWGGLTLFNSCSGSAPVELLAEGQEATVVVEQGSGAKAIGELLVEEKLVGSASDFAKRVSEMGVESQLKPGTYTFAGGTSLDDIVRQIAAGPDMGNALTIPEGYKLSDIAAAVATASEGRITAEAFTAAASDASVYAASYSFLADAGTNSLEGFLFPKTYAVADDATADSLVRMMLDQFQKETASLDWSYPQSQGLSIYDAVNLASIVEKESSGDEQIRAKVAAVFYNRLETTGEPSYGFLQSDATTAYEVGHDPTPEEVHAETPYSTYTNKGLPPTPICSPSLDCLKAVCAPDQESLGKYFFFYFEGDSYYFTETYEDHMNTFS
ncbi:MAG: endolytic transglycosylase MltG [Gordonibacter pamelaeae]|uniref:Endolytic murein transglycosylase n=2 Tax=Gordonibacter pamelaeae TaxID=471189 RepID=D6E905_9ACTN|nr:endolytic transglycosylase MltG [Gordonibacter pamelaeae]MBS4895912.1 endolytic transglycosylase MltG [Gordonibacter pamelaeae]MCB6311075.1 endolytic transglycosylase MltG [Gordonibacter pamelaeae]RDB64130.1 endolytic transglycosylase MltG [Gordonibacter pamelaeae]CBL04202.1 Predicted periplasmic solute-binding protein [Gordonibacter pamelaeae 7-10-1-b]